MKEYRKVEDLFSGLKCRTGLELYSWSYYSDCGGALFWDVSVGRNAFPGDSEDFLRFLAERGLYLEDVDDGHRKWHYAGLQDVSDVWRIQYWSEDDE